MDLPTGEPVPAAAVPQQHDPAAVGDLDGEITAFLDAGMDNFFTDDPDVGQEART